MNLNIYGHEWRSGYYSRIKTDPDGWVDPKNDLPNKYDIVHLKIKDHPMIPGWWTGYGWDGRKWRRGMEVLAWKRKV